MFKGLLSSQKLWRSNYLSPLGTRKLTSAMLRLVLGLSGCSSQVIRSYPVKGLPGLQYPTEEQLGDLALLTQRESCSALTVVTHNPTGTAEKGRPDLASQKHKVKGQN